MTDTLPPTPSSAEPHSERVEIFLPSTLGYEKVARGAAEAVAEEMGFSPDRIDDLKTAVAEACMNAIEHGNQENRTASVTVLLTAAKEQLEISVADEGLSPMPDKFPTPGRPKKIIAVGECFSYRNWWIRSRSRGFPKAVTRSK